MLLNKELDFLIKRHKNKITLGDLLDLYKAKYPNASYIRVAKQLYKDLKIKYEPDYKNIDGVFMRNPDVNKDYGFNSYFIPSGENFLKAEFKKDNGRLAASALFFLTFELSNDSIDNIEQNIHSTADDYLGAFSDIFLDVNQLKIKYSIPVLDDYNKLAENNLHKEEIILSVSKEIKTCNKIIKEVYAENEVLKAKNTLLKAEIAELKAVQAQQAVKKSNDDTQKTITGKSETAYLSIIQALKDELISNGFKNQDELIRFLADKYTGYTGLSETNLRDKFAKANKI
nr:hypothetical protein [uncultured Haemophilus sp.]